MRAQNNVHSFHKRKHFRACKLTQTPSQQISLDDRVPILTNYHRYPRMRKQGVGSPNIKVLGM